MDDSDYNQVSLVRFLRSIGSVFTFNCSVFTFNLFGLWARLVLYKNNAMHA